jgi:hypothetical protein
LLLNTKLALVLVVDAGGALVIITIGAVASRLIVTDCEALPPALLAEHVSVVPDVSALIVVGSQPLLDTISDSASATAQLTATSLVYQPFWPSVPDTAGAISGGVLSLAPLIVSVPFALVLPL